MAPSPDVLDLGPAWLAASRSCLDRVAALDEPAAATARHAELLLGILALDLAFAAARVRLLDPLRGRIALAALGPVDVATFEEARERVRAVRNAATHLADRVSGGLAVHLELDAAGVGARQGGAEARLSLAEWSHWLEVLEPMLSDAGSGAAIGSA